MKKCNLYIENTAPMNVHAVMFPRLASDETNESMLLYDLSLLTPAPGRTMRTQLILGNFFYL